MGFKSGEPCAVGWLQGGHLSILKRRKDIEGLIKVDKNNIIKVADETTPRMIKLIKWLPLPKKQWYPLYLADPEHALTLEVICRKNRSPKKLLSRSFSKKDNPKPIILEKRQKIKLTEAIPMLIEPSDNRAKGKDSEGKEKYGIETMSAENLSTFLEGKQESMLNRTVTDKLNTLMFLMLGAVVGYLLGQVLPIAGSVPV